MARLIAWNLITVDGCFEGAKKWDLDFHNLAWGPELERLCEEFGDRAASLIFGRVTYEGLAAYWKTAEPGRITTYMNALPKLVASRTLASADWNNTRVTADIVPELKRLKETETKTLYVFGSADLTHSLLEEGLVDELMFCTVPVVLGQGTPFFKPGGRIGLELKDTRPLASGSILSTYSVARAA